VDGLGDNAVMLKVRAWANLGDFWPLYFDVHEKVKKAFDENGITIPFPQQDVHLYQ
jgi:small conductance mechanosensitive channel